MSRTRHRSGLLVVGLCLACVFAAGGCIDSVPGEDTDGGLRVTAVPTPAHLVSGGDALVRVDWLSYGPSPLNRYGSRGSADPRGGAAP